MTRTLFDEVELYLQKHFPGSDLRSTDRYIGHEIHVRYELGEPFKNGTDERIEQVNRRVTNIIQDCFADRESIRILIYDWPGPDVMFGNTTPEYLYQLIGRTDLDRSAQRMITERDGEDRLSCRQVIVPASFGDVKYKEILAGIANYEQGREPSIGQAVYFIAPEKDIIFHMYDDRGCLVFSDHPSKLVHLYRKYNEWIVDFHRKAIDRIFERPQ